MRKKILAISGSSRDISSNLTILKFIREQYKEILDVEIYNNLTKLPYFNPDLDTEEAPLEVQAFRNSISDSDGVLICTPEYVFSLPGLLKNAIEWTVSTTLFSEKPVALITASASGEKAHESLLLIMKTLYSKLHEDTNLLINGVKGKVTKDGRISDTQTSEAIKKLMNSFVKVIHSST